MDFKSRANSSINKQKYLNCIYEIIGSHHIVDVNNPQYTLKIEITQDLLCFSIIENYKEYLKYNLQSLNKAFLEENKPKIEEVKKAEEKIETQQKPEIKKITENIGKEEENDEPKLI